MKTEENNKLIAEFMGMKPHDINELDGFWTNTIKAYKFDNVMNLQFNSDWNWLMEVVEKCFKIETNYGLHKNIEDALIFNSENRIQDVYNAVVKFIEVYNESFKQEAVYSIRDNSAKNN